jgi:hypothetical protein
MLNGRFSFGRVRLIEVMVIVLASVGVVAAPTVALPPRPVWSSPIALSAAPPVVGFGAEVVIDSAGTTTAAWASYVQPPDGPVEWLGVVVRRKPAGGRWSAEQVVDPDGRSVEAIQVGAADGVTIVYRRGSDPFAVTGDATGTYSAPVALASRGSLFNVPDGVDDVDLTLAPDGTTTAAWVTRLAAGKRVTVARRPAGGAWRPPTYLSSVATVPVGPVHVAAGPGRQLTAMWLSNRRRTETQGPFPVRVRERTLRAGAWSPTRTVSRDPDRNVQGFALSVGTHGNALAVWQQRDPDRPERFSADVRWRSTRRPDGTWSQPLRLPNPESEPSQGTGVEIARTTGGRVMVVWETWDAEVSKIFAMVRQDGRWQRPVRLSAPGEQGGRALLVEGDDAGRFRVVWTYELVPVFASFFHVKTRYRGVGGRWSRPVTLSSKRLAFGDAALALGPGWSAAVAWSQLAGDGGSRVQYVGMPAS